MSVQDQKNESKRLAKNSLVLYARMLLTMVIGLYTSRVVLQELGVVDFGLYNVIGGVVTMFVFVQGALSNASWRYITVTLGKGNFRQLQITYSTTIYLHVFFCFIILLIGETIGLWFLYNKMSIPADRMDDAFWVYQLSILTMMFTVMSSPSNSLIIAHERMSAFAYVSIYESLAKLAIVYLLIVFPHNKLVYYAILLCVVQASVQLAYTCYCMRFFSEAHLIKVFDKKLVKEMAVFSGFTVLPGLGMAGCGQGLNILLNVFFGPVANAARGISVQVQQVLIRFIQSFQQASNPQITKLYASGEYARMHTLITKVAKFSFFLFMVPAISLMLEMENILDLWLVEVPEGSSLFCIFTLMISMTETISYPFLVAAAANGQIKMYYTINGFLLVSVVPVAYLFLKLGFPAVSVYVVHFIIALLVLYSRSYLGAKLVKYPMTSFYCEILKPIMLVLIPATIVGLSVRLFFSSNSIIDIILTLVVSAASSSVITCFLGMSQSEKRFIIKFITSKLSKKI